MDNEFTIPVTYNGKDLEFPARLLNFGYSVKLEMMIEGSKVIFECDEEKNWRALVPYEDMGNKKEISKDLLKAIAEVIEEITK